jgi:hypothetical protein
MAPTRRDVLGAGVSVLAAPLLRCHDPSIAGVSAAAAPSPTPAAPPPSVAQRILEANRHYDAQFHHGLSNHLSMAIVALHELGAPDARLSAFFERYRSRLEPVPERREPVVHATWAEALGTQSRYADYLAFFQDEVARAGADAAVRAYLPALMPGVAGSSFHPLIRLGYAVHAHDAADVAVSLAYFADQFLRVGGAPASGVSASAASAPLDLLRSIAETPALAHHPQGDRAIFEQIRAVAATPEFAAAAASALAARDVTIPSLADAAAALYAAAPNLTSLHVVTSAHALRVLSPLLDDPAAAGRWLLQAFAAVYVTMGTPAVNPDEDRARTDASAPPSWEAIATAAATSNDEHVIKMVYTCREEAGAYRQPLYQSFAAKRAGLA